nr:immunoglobulin heavy chain junction region [Macaca mulatta]MOW81821.1 immunoglobulin heavy chain junction region [Macaca mulatta]
CTRGGSPLGGLGLDYW